MTIELEFLEQISDDDWPLARSLAFVGEDKPPWQVLSGLYSDKCIEFVNADGNSVPEWKTAEILRNQDSSGNSETFVRITNSGVKRAYE